VSMQKIVEPVLTETVGLSPREVADSAAEQAKTLMDIVDQQGLFTNIQGKKYLQVEAWETIGAFNSVGSDTEWIREFKIDDELIGWQAKVNLVDSRTGIQVGSGISVCGLDEFVAKGKHGVAKHNAVMSMAQTRATSKAYRAKYSWVAVLAGYQPTPAEEMPRDEPQRPAQARKPVTPRVAPRDFAAIIQKMREGLPPLLTTDQFDAAMGQLDIPKSGVVDILGTDLISWLELTENSTTLQALEIVLTALEDKLAPLDTLEF
jgi:hypothetical protein